jgi:hypothetical protein
MHALNAFFGFPKLSINAFNKYSDEFDKQHKMRVGTTKNYFVVPEGDDNNNIFSFIIEKLCKGKFLTKYFAMGCADVCDYLEEVIEVLDGFIEFTEGHVWYTKKSGNSWFIIDCIEKKVKQARNNPLDTGLGHVLVWRVETVPLTNDNSKQCNLHSEPESVTTIDK